MRENASDETIALQAIRFFRTLAPDSLQRESTRPIPLTHLGNTMDNPNKKTPRKVHDINTQIEEENLWDLDDDWDDAGDQDTNEEPQQEIPSADLREVDVEEVVDATPPAVETDEVSEAAQPAPPVEKAPMGDNGEFDFDKEEDLDEDLLKEPVEASTADTSYDEFEPLPEEDEPEELEQSPDTLTEESGDIEASAPATSEVETPVEPLKKSSLSITEKIALSSVAAILIGLFIYSYMWLKGKNNEATEVTLELPIKGEYATITEFSTFWKTPGKSPGIKLGATVVPAANIDLGEGSSSGALRIFFRNANDERIGDTITLNFTNGKFANGSNSIEVSASDGFHLKGDFHAYQMDDSLSWKVYVLEAASSSATGADYKELLETRVAPIMQ